MEEIEEESILPDMDPLEDSKGNIKKEGPDLIREVKIREDLQEYFEVIDHAECKVRCRLAGRDTCEFNGSKCFFKYCSRNGWFRFERHLSRKHKILVGGFLRKKQMAKEVQTKLSKTSGKKVKKRKEDDFSYIQSRHRLGEVNWESLKSVEKYCFVCTSVCPSSNDNSLSSFYFGNDFSQIFPEGSDRLSEQLFVMFFLRDILDFPMTLCVKFLKQCKGMLYPDTWLNFCSNCKNNVIEAVQNRRAIADLERKFLKIKRTLNSLVHHSCLSVRGTEGKANLDPRNIEEQIRKYVCFTLNFQNELDHDENVSTRDVDHHKDRVIYSMESENIELHLPHDDSADSKQNFQKLRMSVKSKVNSPRRKGRKKPKPGFYAKMENFGKERKTDAHKTNLRNVGLIKTDVNDSEFEPVTCKDEPLSPQPPVLDDDGHGQEDDVDFNINEESSQSYSDDSKSDEPTARKVYVKRTRHIKKSKPSVKRESDGHRERDRKEKKKSHRRQVEKGDFMCELCPSKYTNSRSFKEHVNVHKISKLKNNEHDCPHCGFPCLSFKAQKTHIGMKHRDSQDLACSLCTYVGNSKRELLRHLIEHRENSQSELVDGKFHCKFCNRLFISYALLCRHKRIKHYQEMGVAPVRCPVCSEIFSCNQHMRSHVRQVHEKDAKYFCETCGRGFLFISKLKRHALSHVKERTHICEICGADFQYAETLRNHKRKEHNQNVSSTESAAAIQKLGEQADTDLETTSNVEYICKHCGMKFNTKAILHRHVKRDHEELYTFKCNQCGKGYATQQSLKRHKDINHSSIGKPCPYCNKMFSHQDYVRMHFRYCKLNPDRKESEMLAGEKMNEDDPLNEQPVQPQSISMCAPKAEHSESDKPTTQPEPKADTIQLEQAPSPSITILPKTDASQSLRIECIRGGNEPIIIPVCGANYTVIFTNPTSNNI